jgi:2-oxo-3-hexenedioate decarboxylase
MSVDAPLDGFVTSGMLAPYGEPVELGRFIHRRVEPEIAFLLGRQVPASATPGPSPAGRVGERVGCRAGSYPPSERTLADHRASTAAAADGSR